LSFRLGCGGLSAEDFDCARALQFGAQLRGAADGDAGNGRVTEQLCRYALNVCGRDLT
jgi:hypothetical protein